MRADAFVVVQIQVFSETWNPFLFGNNEHVVAPYFTTAFVVGAQHAGVLCQTLNGSLVLGREPKLAAVVVAACGGLNRDLHRLRITDFACGRHILYWRKTAEGKSHAVQVLRADMGVAMHGIGLVGTV